VPSGHRFSNAAHHSSGHIAKPSLSRIFGRLMPAVGSVSTCCAVTAHSNSPRNDSRKCRAAAGVSRRLSMPAMIVDRVIRAKGSLPLVAMARLKMFSRCRRVASERSCQNMLSRYLAISHARDCVLGLSAAVAFRASYLRRLRTR